MIKINLLPFRAIRKRENIKRQISIYIGIIVILFGLMFIISYIHPNLFGELDNVKKKKDDLKKELATYQRTLNKIRTLEKTLKEVKAKLEVIEKLEKGKSGPVYLLSEISDAVPKGKLWLTALSENGGNLSLTGTAMDNATVALFMDNLKASDHIGAVELQSAKLRDIQKYKLKVSDFILSCKIETPKDKPPQETKNKK